MLDANDDDVSCPGCGCEPGDGLTAFCHHPDGCGWAKAQHGGLSSRLVEEIVSLYDTASPALLSEIRKLPKEAVFVDDKDAPQRFSVWLDDDILGAGSTALEALSEAVTLVSRWPQSSWEQVT